MWCHVKYVIDEGGVIRSKAHVDLALLDMVVDEVIQKHRADISLWTVHRRYGRHEFKVNTYCTNQSAGSAIQNDLKNHTFVQELVQAKIIIDIETTQSSRDIEAIGDGSWPNEIKHAWPRFGQFQSEMQLELTQYFRRSHGVEVVSELTTKSLPEKTKLYETIQSQIDQAWGQFGSHAFIHMTHSFFAYGRFASTITTNLIIDDIR